MDTIFALATSLQPSPVALMRISGAACASLAHELLGAEFHAGTLDASIDTSLGRTPCRAWIFKAPRTLTGEDMLELRIPGSPRLEAALEARLRELGARHAQPGEFTRRALEAGKLDLSRAQSVSALINAQSETERRQAMADLAGASARELAALAEQLRALSASYEVAFDFSEDEPEAAPFEKLKARLLQLRASLAAFCAASAFRPRRDIPVVALFGPPNAGKSSLFNALLGRRRALVSELPGTTRDPVRAQLELNGLRCEVRDLSGVGAQDADVGRFAEVARSEAAQADLLLLVCAPTQAPELHREFAALCATNADLPARTLWISTMSDRARTEPQPAFQQIIVSAHTGAGLELLRGTIAARLAAMATGAATSWLRVKACEALDLLGEEVLGAPPEALAGIVRRALVLLDEALVSQAPGEVLDLIFSRFCIGK